MSTREQQTGEVLNWLLDAFHEDLNRTKKRPPYKERLDLAEEDQGERSGLVKETCVLNYTV